VWYRSVSDALESLQTRRNAARLRAATLTELWAELHGPLVELPSDSLEKAERCLPQTSGLVTPAPVANLLSVMTSTFDRAAETVTALFTIQDVALPRLIEIETKVDAAAAQALSVKMPAPATIADVRARLRDLRRQLLEDPLSVDLDAVQAIAAETDQLAADMQTTLKAAAKLGETVTMLETAFGERESAIMAARPRVGEAKLKITQRSAAALDLDGLDRFAAELRAQMEALRVAAPDDAQAALQKAGELAAKLSQLAAATRDLEETATEQMDARRELRGRLDAYRAKAQAVGRAEDIALDSLFRAARKALYRAPCDLAEAERLVMAYQTALTDSPIEDRLS
jgi:DNA repair exonuclease SbcCD ATPase subunit